LFFHGQFGGVDFSEPFHQHFAGTGVEEYFPSLRAANVEADKLETLRFQHLSRHIDVLLANA
jgi:hypothetical protein